MNKLSHWPAHFLLMGLGRVLNWRAGVPWLMWPLSWTITAHRVPSVARLHCNCGVVVGEHPL